MKIGLCVSVLAVIATTVPCATAQSKESQDGTIINVQKQDVATPPVRTGADPVHTPLQSHYYLYDVSVRLNCKVYVGRYQSELDDVPPALSPQNSVPVRVKGRTMFLDFPGDTVKMQIVSHKASREGTCGQAALGK
jgi:hypothetical protein